MWLDVIQDRKVNYQQQQTYNQGNVLKQNV